MRQFRTDHGKTTAGLPGLPDHDSTVTPVEDGFTEYLRTFMAKPFNYNTIAETVRSVLQRSERT